MSIEALIGAYGLPAVAIGAVVEGETVVMAGGAMVGRGLLDRNAVIAAAALGSFLGDQGWFMLARRWRHQPRLQAIAGSRIFAKAQRMFQRHPSLFVFGFRFAYGFRTVSPIAIGMTDYPARRFLAINAIAALIWACIFVNLGDAFGRGVEAILGPLKAHEHLILVLSGGGLLAFAGRRLLR